MKFDVKTQGKKMEVALEGRMDSATAPGFEKEIFQKLDGVTELVLDFTDLAYLSSAGLRVLLSCQKKLMERIMKVINENIGNPNLTIETITTLPALSKQYP